MKVRIKTLDLIKMIFGKRILINNITYNSIIEIKKGKENYICK